MSILPKLGEHDKAILNSIFNPTMPLGELVYENETDLPEDSLTTTPDDENLIRNELEAIKYAEEGEFNESLKLFQDLLHISPERAATYNNRAQVYRMMGNSSAAYSDLTRAIELNNGVGKACCQAYCQRGVLFRKDGDDEKARDDFQKAARLGSKFAKQQLVELNPYAALCNEMLSRAMEQLNQ